MSAGNTVTARTVVRAVVNVLGDVVDVVVVVVAGSSQRAEGGAGTCGCGLAAAQGCAGAAVVHWVERWDGSGVPAVVVAVAAGVRYGRVAAQ